MVRVDKTTMDGGGRSLSAIGDFELLDDAVHVVADGIAADVERGTDLLVGEAARKHLQHFEFTRSELGPHHALGETLCNLARKVALPMVHGPNGFHHVGLRSVLEKVSLGTGLDGTVDIFVRLVAGEDDDADVNAGSDESVQRIDSVQAGHAQVEEQKVDSHGPQHSDGLFST